MEEDASSTPLWRLSQPGGKFDQHLDELSMRQNGIDKSIREWSEKHDSLADVNFELLTCLDKQYQEAEFCDEDILPIVGNIKAMVYRAH